MKFIFISNAAPPTEPTVTLSNQEIAVIGIAVGVPGVVVIGVVIVFIIGFFVYRKKRKLPERGIYYLNTCTINKACFVLYIALEI